MKDKFKCFINVTFVFGNILFNTHMCSFLLMHLSITLPNRIFNELDPNRLQSIA